MQTINQIIFSIFALILICIYLATIKKENHSDYRFLNSYWTNSILYKATAFGAWALSPALGKTLLLLANFSFYISALFLILFFRSWRVSVAKELVPYAYFLALIASGFFLSLLLLDNSYIIRLNFSIGIITILTTLAAYEVWNLLKDTKSLLLKLIFIFLSLQISMSMVDIYIINTQKISEVKSILDLDVEASMYLWITFSFHLIIYVMINSFLYEQLWLSEKTLTGNY